METDFLLLDGRVHYPLPLSFVDVPPMEALQATIRRLRNELEESKRGSKSGGELEQLRQENAELRQRVSIYLFCFQLC